MPLDRVSGEQFDVLVDHTDGQVRHPCSRGLTPSCFKDLSRKATRIVFVHAFVLARRSIRAARKVGLRYLVGFKLQLALSSSPRPPADVVVRRPMYERAGMRATGRTSCVPVVAAGTRSDF